MTISRRALLRAAGALGLPWLRYATSARAAEWYEGKTLTLIVGFAPGGGVDTTARVIARHLVRFLPGQPGVVVQNREGSTACSPWKTPLRDGRIFSRAEPCFRFCRTNRSWPDFRNCATSFRSRTGRC